MTEVHPSAVISSTAKLGKDVVVGPNCVIEGGSVIGDGCILECNVYIGKDVKVGMNNQFYPNCMIGPAAQILGNKRDTPIGGVVIGDNNVIRELVTIHKSMYPGKNTVIGNRNLIMVGVHIGHDCLLENDIVMSNYGQVSGHCQIQKGAWLSGMVLIHQFTTVGKWCYASGLAGINHDVPPFVIVSGHYPPKVRGVNVRGLRRAGLSEEEQQQVSKAYRRLYRSKNPLLENAKALVSENGWCESARDMAQMIIKSSEQRFGRSLELHRH